MAHLHLTLSPLVDDPRVPAARGSRERSTNDSALVACGPGWFDSSWELGRGLDVREGLPGNLGLNEWLAICLAGPQPAHEPLECGVDARLT